MSSAPHATPRPYGDPLPSAELARAIEHLLARRDADGILRIVRDDPSDPSAPILRRTARSVPAEIDRGLMEELIEAMAATLRAAPGVGLAAPQIGLSLALAFLEDPGSPGEDPHLRGRVPLPLMALADPVISPIGSNTQVWEEGCLSVPGRLSDIERFTEVSVSTRNPLDLAAPTAAVELHGWPARIAQHETGHLHGVICHDLATA